MVSIFPRVLKSTNVSITRKADFGENNNDNNIANDENSLLSPLLSQLDEETLVPIEGDESNNCEGLLLGNTSFKSGEEDHSDDDNDESGSIMVEEGTSSLSAWKSVLLLNFVAILWGTQHAVIKSILDDHAITPNAFSFFRFFLSTLIIAPYTPKSRNTWRWGAELGLYMFAGYAMQAVGLQYTTAQKSGFLLYLNVKFVPIINVILFRKNNKNVHVWLSAFIAFLGTALLAFSPTSPHNDASRMRMNWNIGDLWSIGAAVASAMYIIRLEHALQQMEIREEGTSTAQLNSASLWVVTILCLVWNLVQMDYSSVFTPSTIQHLSHHLYPILYLSFIVTALANQIQSIGQQTLSAERASIIYAMDPVYGAIFSYLLLNEKLSIPWGYIGASLITIAAVTNAIIEMKQKQKKTNKPNDNN